MGPLTPASLHHPLRLSLAGASHLNESRCSRGHLFWSVQPEAAPPQPAGASQSGSATMPMWAALPDSGFCCSEGHLPVDMASHHFLVNMCWPYLSTVLLYFSVDPEGQGRGVVFSGPLQRASQKDPLKG